MKHFMLTAAVLGATAISPAAFAQDSDVSVSTGVDYVTEYVFRGVAFAGAAVQPYAEISTGNFTVGGWFSTAIGEDSAAAGDEFDLYAGYSVPLDSSISLDIGATYYHFPQGGSFLSTKDGNSGSYEVSASVGFGEVPFEPSLTAYYDFTFEAFTIEGSAGHSVPIGDAQSFDLGLTVGHVEVKDASYEWATASAALSHAFSDDVSAYLGANYALSSEDSLDFKTVPSLAGETIVGGPTESDKFWISTGISAGF